MLGVDVIADTDTFVSLGGDSLSYVEASIALEALLGDLPPDWPNVRGRSARPPPWRRVVARRRASRPAWCCGPSGIVLIVGHAHQALGRAGRCAPAARDGRLQLRALPGHHRRRLRSIARIAVPSVVWLAIATQINPRIRWEHVLHVNGWLGGETAHGGYWFVEALLQILVPLTLLLAIPAVGRAERADPLRFAAGALAVGLLVRFHVIDLPVVEPHDIRPHDIFWMFAIGWTAAHVRTTGARLALSSVVVGAVPGYFGEPQREVLIVVGLLLLLWVPTLPVPRALTRADRARWRERRCTSTCATGRCSRRSRASFGPVAALVGSLAGRGAAVAARSTRLERIARRQLAPRRPRTRSVRSGRS